MDGHIEQALNDNKQQHQPYIESLFWIGSHSSNQQRILHSTLHHQPTNRPSSKGVVPKLYIKCVRLRFNLNDRD